MKFKTTLTFTTVLTAIVTVASSTTGYANTATDTKVFPGSVCKSEVAQGVGGLFYSGRTIYNTAADRTTTRYVRLSCPLPRDNVLKPWKLIVVWVRDNSEIAHVRCAAANYKADVPGARGGKYQDVQLSGATPSFRDISALIFHPLPRQFNSGPFTLNCLLPGNVAGSGDFSAIYTIWLLEEFTIN